MSVANVRQSPASAPRAYWSRNASKAKALNIRTKFQSKRAAQAVRHPECAFGQAGTSSLAEYLPSRWRQRQRCETLYQAGRSKRDADDVFLHRSPRTRVCEIGRASCRERG